MAWVATAVVGGAVIGGLATSSAADTAAGAQQATSEASIAEQRRQFNKLQEMLAPYNEAGLGALGQQQALLGMSGTEAQQAAISGIEQSPIYQSLARQGEEAMLQNAAATGGLRGGNLQGALAQYRPQLLNQLIDQRYNRLAGLTQIGQNSAAGVGTAGMNMANQISNQYGQIGAAQAGNALAQGQALGGIGTSIGSLGVMAAMNPGMFSSGGTGGVNWGAF